LLYCCTLSASVLCYYYSVLLLQITSPDTADVNNMLSNVSVTEAVWNNLPQHVTCASSCCLSYSVTSRCNSAWLLHSSLSRPTARARQLVAVVPDSPSLSCPTARRCRARQRVTVVPDSASLSRPTARHFRHVNRFLFLASVISSRVTTSHPVTYRSISWFVHDGRRSWLRQLISRALLLSYTAAADTDTVTANTATTADTVRLT